MILVGELEFTNKGMYPDGHAGFLFVGTIVYKNSEGKPEASYVYAISPVEHKKSWNVGDVFQTRENLSVTEFLQRIVDMDIEVGRGVYQKFPDDAKVRLKGMTEWITRTPIKPAA